MFFVVRKNIWAVEGTAVTFGIHSTCRCTHGASFAAQQKDGERDLFRWRRGISHFVGIDDGTIFPGTKQSGPTTRFLLQSEVCQPWIEKMQTFLVRIKLVLLFLTFSASKRVPEKNRLGRNENFSFCNTSHTFAFL